MRMKNRLYFFIITIAAVLIFMSLAFGPAYAESDQLLNDSGLVYYYKNQYQQALKEFMAALRLNSKNPEIYYNIGRAHYQLKNLKDAEEALKKCVELKSNYTVAKNLLKKIQAELAKQDKSSVSAFSKKFKVQIPSEISYPYDDFTEGFYAYYSGDRSASKEKFDIDTKDKSLEVHARMDQAIIYYHMRNFEDAINSFNKVIDKDPKNAHAYYNLGLAYEQALKTDDAMDMYQHAYSLDAKMGQAKERLKMVKDNVLMNQMNTADAYFNKSDWRNAIGAYEKVKTYALPSSREFEKADSNMRVAKLELEKISSRTTEINQGFLARNVEFGDANANRTRYIGSIVTWKGRIYRIEKSGSDTDFLMIYLPSFKSDIDETEYLKDLLFVVRFERALKPHELIREDADVTVVGKITGSEQLRNAFKYNTYNEKVVIKPLKITVTHRSYSGELVLELQD